ncbi:MAG: class II aldolase/adducin family protein [Azoarcus sp.]|jgi:hypothetical protein|nr:class II aldolase/adducin family protein [Azoarcus sp.]
MGIIENFALSTAAKEFVASVKADGEKAFRVLRETGTTTAYGTVGFVVRIPGEDKLVVVNDPGPWNRGEEAWPAIYNLEGRLLDGNGLGGDNRYAKLFRVRPEINIISHVHTPYVAVWGQTHRTLPVTYVAFQRHHLLREIPIYIDRRQAEVDFIIDRIEENPHNTAILEANGGGTVWGKKGIREQTENIILFEEAAQLATLSELVGGPRTYGPGVLWRNWNMTGLFEEGKRLGLVPVTDLLPPL